MLNVVKLHLKKQRKVGCIRENRGKGSEGGKSPLREERGLFSKREI